MAELQIHVPKLLEATVVNNNIQIQVTKNYIINRDYAFFDSSEVEINVWASEVGWGKPNLVLPFKNHIINYKYISIFSNKLIIYHNGYKKINFMYSRKSH